MNLLPGWAPNFHPLVVHFPIALLITAAAVDIVGWVLWCNQSLRRVATVLYVLGTLAAAAAYVTGRAAAQTIWLPGVAHAIVSAHWDWAFRTVSYFGIVTAVRLVLLRSSRRQAGPAIGATFALAGLVGLGLLYETGDRGGQLVYQHGVGTVRP